MTICWSKLTSYAINSSKKSPFYTQIYSELDAEVKVFIATAVDMIIGQIKIDLKANIDAIAIGKEIGRV